MTRYFVYVLRCADGTLYTGYTNDPKARLRAHNSGKGAKYTRGRRPVTLVYLEKQKDLSAALKREGDIKKMRRALKVSLASHHSNLSLR